MPGWCTEIFRQRQIDHAFHWFQPASHNRFVILGHRASLKLPAKFALGFRRECHKHYARRIAIEPMYATGGGEIG